MGADWPFPHRYGLSYHGLSSPPHPARQNPGRALLKRLIFAGVIRAQKFSAGVSSALYTSHAGGAYEWRDSHFYPTARHRKPSESAKELTAGAGDVLVRSHEMGRAAGRAARSTLHEPITRTADARPLARFQAAGPAGAAAWAAPRGGYLAANAQGVRSGASPWVATATFEHP